MLLLNERWLVVYHAITIIVGRNREPWRIRAKEKMFWRCKKAESWSIWHRFANPSIFAVTHCLDWISSLMACLENWFRHFCQYLACTVYTLRWKKNRYYSINAAIVSPAIVVHIVWYLFHNHINTISNGVMYLADKKVCCFGYGVSFFPFKIVTKGFRGSFFAKPHIQTELHIWNGLPLLWGVLMPFLISLVLLVTINQPRLSIWSFPKISTMRFLK